MGQWNRDGQPMRLFDWVLNIADDEYRHVAFTEVKDAKIVTVWLGVAAGFDKEGRPIIFETTVYDCGSLTEVHTYATEDDAKYGHGEACARVRAVKGVSDDNDE